MIVITSSFGACILVYIRYTCKSPGISAVSQSSRKRSLLSSSGRTWLYSSWCVVLVVEFGISSTRTAGRCSRLFLLLSNLIVKATCKHSYDPARVHVFHVWVLGSYELTCHVSFECLTAIVSAWRRMSKADMPVLRASVGKEIIILISTAPGILTSAKENASDRWIRS